MKPGALALRIAQSIADHASADCEALATERVSGGCIHEAWRLDIAMAEAPGSVFVKVNAASAIAMFEAEAEGLALLASAKAVRVPRPMLCEQDDDRAWIVLEWLELVPLDAGSGARLGASLAAQHRVTAERFGGPNDNFIGASRQQNGWLAEWLAFWRERRIVPQLRLAAANRLPSRLIDRGERLLDDCEPFFARHEVKPSLLHGDLWSGNAAALVDGTPVVFDPAAYYGDREADLAMTELFGGFPADFHAAYRAAWPLDDGFEARRGFYNLYHLLNHANLFAGDYVAQAQDRIERLLAEIR